MSATDFTEEGYAQDAFTRKYTYDEATAAIDIATELMADHPAEGNEGKWDEIGGSRGMVLICIEAAWVFEQVYNARDDEPDWMGCVFEFASVIRKAFTEPAVVGDTWSSLIGVNMGVPAQNAARVTLRKMATAVIDSIAHQPVYHREIVDGPTETIFDKFQRAAEASGLSGRYETFEAACDALDVELRKPEYADVEEWYLHINDVAGNDPDTVRLMSEANRKLQTEIHEDVNLWFANAHEGQSGSMTAFRIREALRRA
jgi:hypothetical protein